MGKKIEIELPDYPDLPAAPDLSLHPIIAELRERTATLEERTKNATGETAAEALRLAGEAHQLAADAKNKVENLVAQNIAPERPPVIELHPPAPLPVPEPDPDQPIGSETPTHLPIWHPHRWF